MIDLVAAYREEIARRISQWPQHTNRASSLGHPCERFLTYCRTHGDKRSLPNVSQQFRFEDGAVHEKAVLRILEDAGERFGFSVVERQRDLAEDPFFRTHQISGHPDAMVADDKTGATYPIDVKSCSPFVFKRLNTLEDMQRDKSAYVQQYPAQIQLYLLGTGRPEGAFLLKDKASGEPKQINAELDYQYAEALVQKADRINAHVAAGTLPEPINDEATCTQCPFLAICMTSLTFGRPPVVRDDPELIEKVERWFELKAAHAEYERLNKELGSAFEAEDNMIVGNWHVSGEYRKRKGYTVEATEFWQKVIKPLDGPKLVSLEDVA